MDTRKQELLGAVLGATTPYLIKFYCLGFIFCAKVHYFKQIKHETSENINKMNNDFKLLHKDLSLFKSMFLH